MRFTVIDKQTGEPPDMDAISQEPFAAGLIMGGDSFVLSEEGGIGIEDRCGNVRWSPEGRFEVRIVE